MPAHKYGVMVQLVAPEEEAVFEGERLDMVVLTVEMVHRAIVHYLCKMAGSCAVVQYLVLQPDTAAVTKVLSMSRLLADMWCNLVDRCHVLARKLVLHVRR